MEELIQFEQHHIIVVAAIVSFMLEIFVAGTLLFTSIGCGLLFAAGANYIGDSVETQIFWFIVGLIGSFVISKFIFNKYAYHNKIETNTMIGKKGEVLGNGLVKIQGEIWKYESSTQYKPGTRVIVKGIDGLTVLI